MTGFVLGMIFMGCIWGANAGARSIMSKVHKDDPEEMAKMKIPIYPIISYAKFHFENRDNEDKKTD